MIDTRKAWRINELRAQGWGDRAEAFAEWQDEMNKHVQARLCVSIHDMPDWDFASAFEASESPRDAAKRFIEDMSRDMGFDADDY